MASHEDLKPKPENYDDAPTMVTIRWLFERRIAELEEQGEMFKKMMEAILIDEEAKGLHGMLALAAKAAADEIRDYLMPLFSGIIDIEMPLRPEMDVYYTDKLSEDRCPGAWGPIMTVDGDVVVHLKAMEVDDAEVPVGDSEGQEKHGATPH